ncbi:hypothetical protein EFA02_17200 [Enterococcus faecalis]|nr:hypothetical protein EFA02_17200 [Enterococcus faecalis]
MGTILGTKALKSHEIHRNSIFIKSGINHVLKTNSNIRCYSYAEPGLKKARKASQFSKR